MVYMYNQGSVNAYSSDIQVRFKFCFIKYTKFFPLSMTPFLTEISQYLRCLAVRNS